MHLIVREIVGEIDNSVYQSVARSVLGNQSALLVGQPRWTEIEDSHADLRTLAILRVEGFAAVGKEQFPWSSVQKLIDTNADAGPGNAGGWVDPAREEVIYESGLFKIDGIGFRPAKCHLITEPRPGFKMFWLEDLTDADRAPFSIAQLHEITRDLGKFNGHFASGNSELRLEIPTCSNLIRWNGSGYDKRVQSVSEAADLPWIQRVLGTTNLKTVNQLHDVLHTLNDQSQRLRRSISFGDCNAGNLFRLSDETVAVDWASVTMDPIGVDAGCLVGSSIVRSEDPRRTLEAEGDLFLSYLESLRSGGWNGDDSEIRIGFLCQFGNYLMTPIARWHLLFEDSPEAHFWRNWAEKRYQAPLDEIPDKLAPIVESYPRYIEEISQLLASGY